VSATGFGVVAQLGFFGAGSERAGDLGPGVPVEPGGVDQFGQAALGLVDEAGDQGDGSQVVAEPGAGALGERGERGVDQVVGVVAALRAGDGHGCLLPVVTGIGAPRRMLVLGAGPRVAVRTGMSHGAGTLLLRQAGPVRRR
jgi:hypothetical protein